MPSAAPQKDLSKALLGIGTQEWPEIFHTLTTVRRLSLHHSALVMASRYPVNNSCITLLAKQTYLVQISIALTIAS